MPHDAFDAGRKSDTAAADAPPGLTSRVVLWLVLGVVAVHTAAIALWVAPDNLLRQQVGASRLSSYILPMFNQSWSVFAPEADFGYELIQLRAQLRDKSGTTTTGWIKVTAREVVPAVKYHPFPSRTSAMSTRLAGDLLQSFNALSQGQQQIVGASGAAVGPAQLRQRLLAAATTPAQQAQATSFSDVEDALEYYLSGIANAVWGDRVLALQFRRSQITVTQYSAANPQRQVESGYGYYSNWRTPRPLTAADKDAFDDYAHEFGIR